MGLRLSEFRGPGGPKMREKVKNLGKPTSFDFQSKNESSDQSTFLGGQKWGKVEKSEQIKKNYPKCSEKMIGSKK